MADKYLFERFNEDKRIYNLNQGYWKRKLQSKLKQRFSNENILFQNIDANGKKLYDANPIFTFIDSSQTKAIRIIQDDIKFLSDNTNVLDEDLISAWIDEIYVTNSNRDINYDDQKVSELVIALFLTKETVNKTMKLIINWLNNELTSENIEQILGE